MGAGGRSFYWQQYWIDKAEYTVMTEGTHYLTTKGREKLQKELEHLRKVKRPEIARNLRAAIEEGDLSENAGYEESKRDQAFAEGRIRKIEAILANARVLDDQADSNRDSVTVGARVTVAEEGGEPETYRIVGPAEADPLAGCISNESPLGKALLGRGIGEMIDVTTPGGVICFEIRAIG